MLTAAVRDLHLCYPGQFQTDVRTSCPALWEHNPYLVPLSELDPEVECIDCDYPLIDDSNTLPYHCLHGFIEFLNTRLGLRIKPTAFRGDIHLSEQERAWYSQVREVTGEDIPFWIIAAGGKYDITIKWWDTMRYQEVVNGLHGKVQFVQVGATGHNHPRLQGVIDLRGQTSLRELIRLVYHSDGVLCSVTALMHLAAAVPVRPEVAGDRPCVVIAGGREPAHWEAYPSHQFIATTGSLPCCAKGGCWKARTSPLGDGSERDHPENLCLDVVGSMPRCMDLITSSDVIRRISIYLAGGTCRPLSCDQRKAAWEGIRATASNEYDRLPLTLQSAGLACDRFAATIPPFPAKRFEGRGIVICSGGVKYFPPAWVCIKMLRRVGCRLPIQLWYLGEGEMDERMRSLVSPLGVECIDATRPSPQITPRIRGGWELKAHAILFSRFQEVLFLDADNAPVLDPEYLFDTIQYRQSGAIFWPDFADFDKSKIIWDSCGLTRPVGPEFESGQIVVDKARCWKALRLALWFNENSDFYYQHLHGDKETFHLAFHKVRKSYGFVPHQPERLRGTMCQHDFEGNRVFQHRNTDKWNIFLTNQLVEGFLFEGECREYVADLRSRWDGGIERHWKRSARGPTGSAGGGRGLAIRACMISCPQRQELRLRTLEDLAKTDWGEEPTHVEIDADTSPSPQERQKRTALAALKRAVDWTCDFVLFLEDDLMFNRHLRHNLTHWRPALDGRFALAGLYNPGHAQLACSASQHCCVVSHERVFGSQAFLLSKPSVKFAIERWNTVEGMQDIKLARILGGLGHPVVYHVPSLVQHVGITSTWGGQMHSAKDFDPDWKTPN